MIQLSVTTDSHRQIVLWLVAEAEIMFAHLDQARSNQLFGDQNFVFSGDLKKLIGLARLMQKQ